MSEGNDEYGFVELHRTFREVSANAGEADYPDLGNAFHLGERLQWADLLDKFRVVALSEAGTGKTEELRHVAETLRGEGKPAFFLRLEHIPNDFEEAFEAGSFEEFEGWLAAGNEAWLLLDSVDEARLRSPGDFELAIRKLGRRIAGALQRVRIVIAGRTTPWRPKTDLDLCLRHLPYEPPSVTATAADETEEEGLDLDFHTHDQPAKEEQSVFKIVSLDPLDSRQVETFARARGLRNPTAFLDAVERADAWSFTARPQDLEELVDHWNDHGPIGSRTGILQNSIDRRLSERDQGCADACPLLSEK